MSVSKEYTWDELKVIEKAIADIHLMSLDHKAQGIDDTIESLAELREWWLTMLKPSGKNY